MIKIILCGCNGRMGKVISRCVSERDDCEIVAGVDMAGVGDGGYPVFPSPLQVPVSGDVIIDFSHPSVLDGLLEFATHHKIPVVISTTGYSEEQVKKIKAASEQIPIFFSGNMSLGINLLIELSKRAAAVLGPDFDIEIVEKHHNNKIDAPSGTALMLANAVKEEMEPPVQFVYDRHTQREKRSKQEIGIHSVRGGTIVGEHDVIFAGHDEVITLSHSAQSREVSAVGSVNAALFLAGRQPGMYQMSDLLADR